MANWRDPKPEDYRLPSRKELFGNNSSFWRRIEFLRIIQGLGLLALVLITIFTSSRYIILSRNSVPTKEVPLSNNDIFPTETYSNYPLVSVAFSIRNLEANTLSTQILEQLLVLSDNVEDPFEKTVSLLSISESYLYLKDPDNSKKVLLMALNSVNLIEDSKMKVKLSPYFIKIYSMLSGEADILLSEKFYNEIQSELESRENNINEAIQ